MSGAERVWCCPCLDGSLGKLIFAKANVHLCMRNEWRKKKIRSAQTMQATTLASLTLLGDKFGSLHTETSPC